MSEFTASGSVTVSRENPTGTFHPSHCSPDTCFPHPSRASHAGPPGARSSGAEGRSPTDTSTVTGAPFFTREALTARLAGKPAPVPRSSRFPRKSLSQVNPSGTLTPASSSPSCPRASPDEGQLHGGCPTGSSEHAAGRVPPRVRKEQAACVCHHEETVADAQGRQIHGRNGARRPPLLLRYWPGSEGAWGPSWAAVPSTACSNWACPRGCSWCCEVFVLPSVPCKHTCCLCPCLRDKGPPGQPCNGCKGLV